MTEAKSVSRRKEDSAVTRAAEGLREDREVSGRCGITEVLSDAGKFISGRQVEAEGTPRGMKVHERGC